MTAAAGGHARVCVYINFGASTEMIGAPSTNAGVSTHIWIARLNIYRARLQTYASSMPHALARFTELSATVRPVRDADDFSHDAAADVVAPDRHAGELNRHVVESKRDVNASERNVCGTERNAHGSARDVVAPMGNAVGMTLLRPGTMRDVDATARDVVDAAENEDGAAETAAETERGVHPASRLIFRAIEKIGDSNENDRGLQQIVDALTRNDVGAAENHFAAPENHVAAAKTPVAATEKWIRLRRHGLRGRSDGDAGVGIRDWGLGIRDWWRSGDWSRVR